MPVSAHEEDVIPGLNLIHRGKVRDTYEIPEEFQPAEGGRVRLVVTSDRISAHDFVLPFKVPGKGRVLNAMNVYCRGQLRGVSHDLVAYGKGIDRFLPPELRDNVDRQCRSIIVHELQMVPVECVMRGYLTGSGWTSYRQNGTVCGHNLPTGYQNGSKLDVPLFTPTTKAEHGHDEALDYEAVNQKYGDVLQMWSHEIYEQLCEVARKRDIVIADTKFEFGYHPDDPKKLVLGDEVCTPDSSRFWRLAEWTEAQGRGVIPVSRDKQPVRNECALFGIDKFDPNKPEHQERVRSLKFPDALAETTAATYQEIFRMFTGQSLVDFQMITLGVPQCSTR